MKNLDTMGTHKLSDLTITFEVQVHELFDVEVATQGSDIIYHFWPSNGRMWFIEGARPDLFGKALENGFKAVLPQTMDVRADYTPPEASQGLLRQGESPESKVQLRETYYVRVVGGAKRPMCDHFLKGVVFQRINEQVRKVLI